jgi:hypothetical protein
MTLSLKVKLKSFNCDSKTINYTEDPLKGLNAPMKKLINMVVKNLEPYFAQENKQEAVYRLKQGLALIVTMENLHQQPRAYRDAGLRGVCRGMTVAGNTIGKHLLSVLERGNPQELQEYLFEYAQGLVETTTKKN